MAGWEAFLFGWGNVTLDLEAGDAIASGDSIFAGELRAGGGAGVGVFESHRLRRKLQQRPQEIVSKSEVLALGPGDAIASGESIEVTSEAAKIERIDASIDVTPGDAEAG